METTETESLRFKIWESIDTDYSIILFKKIKYNLKTYNPIKPKMMTL